jgi:hypothetical protein
MFYRDAIEARFAIDVPSQVEGKQFPYERARAGE